jgi:PAS domain S-box-containing protein
MSDAEYTLTGVEAQFDAMDIIVSKTDIKGRITYCNRTFIDISGYPESELMGAPHSVLRHPAMPRGVFRLLWDTIMSGNEIFAYVINRTRLGDHYWVLAHVTPTYDSLGGISGYHSSRRVPDRQAVEKIKPLYDSLRPKKNGIKIGKRD